MLNIAIVDDEQEMLDMLKGYTDQFFSEQAEKTEYKADCYSGGFQFLSAPFNAYDIVFMDIKMPMMNGLDVAREYRENNRSAAIIFITNMAEMAIRGYEVSATDFVIKPVSYNDFCYTLKKAIKHARYNMQEHIILMNNRRIVKIPVRDILFIESNKHKLTYHMVEGDLEDWGSMSQAESRLAQYHFARCNSCYLVNLRYVEEITGNTVCVGSHRLIISRNRKAKFTDIFMNYLGGRL